MASTSLHMQSTRQQILEYMQRHGRATVKELGALLGLTSTGIRQHLTVLERDGLVDTREERGRVGRPTLVYSLTEQADALFPKRYDELAVAMLDAVGEELGPDAALRVLERVSNDRVAAFAPSVEGRTMEEKLGVLTGWYFEGDPHMDFASAGDDYVLIERNCPYYNTAMHRPALCSVTVNALTRLLGVRVARQETFQNGDGRCVFHVYAQQPVTDPRFALET